MQEAQILRNVARKLVFNYNYLEVCENRTWTIPALTCFSLRQINNLRRRIQYVYALQNKNSLNLGYKDKLCSYSIAEIL